MSVTWLEPLHADTVAAEQLLGVDHPHNPLVRRVLLGDDAAEHELARRYSAMADIWTEWSSGHRQYYTAPLEDALNRVGVGSTLELSAGTGQGTEVLIDRGVPVIATEPAPEMATELAQRWPVPTVRATAGRLPFAGAAFDLVVGLNAVMTAAEVLRVLRPGGSILWCYSFAESTPVYIDPPTLSAALGLPAVVRRVGPGLWIHLGGTA